MKAWIKLSRMSRIISSISSTLYMWTDVLRFFSISSHTAESFTNPVLYPSNRISLGEPVSAFATPCKFKVKIELPYHAGSIYFITIGKFKSQWQCPPQLPQLPLQPFPLFLSFTILLTARPAITTTIAPTTTVPILYSFPVSRNVLAEGFYTISQTLYEFSPINITTIYAVSIF